MIDILEQHRPLFDALGAQGLDYRLVRTDSRLTTILIKEAYRARVPKLMKSLKYKALLHPYGKWFGYHFLYQLKEFQLYAAEDVLIEVYFSLPCMSLTPKTWIPLDKMINDSVWLHRNERDAVPFLDSESDFIFRLTQCIFARGSFDEQSRAFFREWLPRLDSDGLREKLQTVFFKYTDPLLLHLRDGAFDQLVADYHRFTEY